MYCDWNDGRAPDTPDSGPNDPADTAEGKSRPGAAARPAGRGKFTLSELTDLNNASENDLVRPCDIRGILHSHSSYTDGSHSIAEMAEIAAEIGLEYLGISDHFESHVHQCGLDLEGVCYQRGEVDELQAKLPHLDLFQGIELDAGPRGELPLDDETLKVFDYVIVSFPETHDLTYEERTHLVARVALNPRVTILGLPVGDWILREDDGILDLEKVMQAAARGRTALEVNANPTRLPINWQNCLMAQEMGVKMVISPNAHRAARLVDYRHGAQQANSAGLCCGSFLNTLSSDQLREYLAQDR